MCQESACKRKVPWWSNHTVCFACVTKLRGGVPCEPPTLCEACAIRYENETSFRDKMDKAKKDRQYAAKAHVRKMLQKSGSNKSDESIVVEDDDDAAQSSHHSTSDEGTTVDKSLREYPIIDTNLLTLIYSVVANFLSNLSAANLQKVHMIRQQDEEQKRLEAQQRKALVSPPATPNASLIQQQKALAGQVQALNRKRQLVDQEREENTKRVSLPHGTFIVISHECTCDSSEFAAANS